MSLFGRSEIAAMRDRTKKRNYSAEADEFRREHKRHREWGLQQRHAAKLSRLRRSRSAPPTPPISDRVQAPPTTPASPPPVPDVPPVIPAPQPSQPQPQHAPPPSRQVPPTPAPVRHPLTPAPVRQPTASAHTSPLVDPASGQVRPPDPSPQSALSARPSPSRSTPRPVRCAPRQVAAVQPPTWCAPRQVAAVQPPTRPIVRRPKFGRGCWGRPAAVGPRWVLPE
jgi:hypothetical protein